MPMTATQRQMLSDEEFLTKIDSMRVRVQYAKIELWTFDEKTLKRTIEGIATGGSLTVNGTSAVRRTLSLSLAVQEAYSDITRLENEISMNKKVDVSVGYKNPFKEYIDKYGEILWFPCGRFVVTSASVTRDATNWTISLQGKDKMVLLDGSVGGSLPASVTFNEVELEDGTIEYPTLLEIIKQAVHQYGHEDYQNIIINDLEETATTLMQYTGTQNIYFNSEFTNYIYKDVDPELYEGDSRKELQDLYDKYPHKVVQGQNIFYEETALTYPGELVLNAGDSVTSLLTKINETLGGNYEFFYNLDGQFVFQEKKNYLNTESPLNELDVDNYVETYSTTKCKYVFNDLSEITSFSVNPKYENIKNDFIVWGTRSTVSGGSVPIRYHLVIDERPTDLSLAQQVMWAVYDENDTYQENLLRYEFTNPQYDSDDKLIFSGTFVNPQTAYVVESGLPYEIRTESKVNDYGTEVEISYKEYIYPRLMKTASGNEHWYVIALPSTEWREELYRRALINNLTSYELAGYDTELLAEWRKLYDNLNSRWDDTSGWNPAVIYDPAVLDYWLDFIDSYELGEYSVNNIGKRSKIVNENSVKCLYQREPYEDLRIITPDKQTRIPEYDLLNQKYFLLSNEDYTDFSISTTGVTALDKMRSLLSSYLIYNTSISIVCIPRYYFEPNSLIYVNDQTDNAYNGTYFMTQFTLPLTYNGTMSITANQLAKRI